MCVQLVCGCATGAPGLGRASWPAACGARASCWTVLRLALLGLGALVVAVGLLGLGVSGFLGCLVALVILVA